MTRDDSAFQTWFEAQFGPRPSQKPLEELMHAREFAAKVSARADLEYEATLEWERRCDAALKGWCARDPR